MGSINCKLIPLITPLDITDLAHLMEISKCGKYLVVASLCNNVVIFVRGEKKVGRRTLIEWRHYMTLPQYNYPAATLTIHPKQTHRLTISYTNHKLIEYDMEEFEFLFSAVIVDSDRGLRCHVNQNVVCDPQKTDSWLVQNEKEVLAVSKGNSQNGRSPDEDSADEDIDAAGILIKKAKNELEYVAKRNRNYSTRVVKEANVSWFWEESFDQDELTVSFPSQHLVHLSWLGDDELVSVQISSESLLEQLPPTLKLKKYGTG